MLFQFSARAWEEYIYWQSQDKKTLKRIEPENDGNSGKLAQAMGIIRSKAVLEKL